MAKNDNDNRNPAPTPEGEKHSVPTGKAGVVDGHGANEEQGAVENPAPVADADKSSDPGPYTHSPEGPPVRSPRPEAELSVSLAQGAGQHVPPDPAKYDATGRPRA